MTCKRYDIPKTMIWEAWLHVKANQGAAGIDAETIERFEDKLGDNLYKLWNRMGAGSYFPPPVKAGTDPEEVRRRPDTGHPDRSRQNRADRGQDVAGATA
jgi:hypothetical protein